MDFGGAGRYPLGQGLWGTVARKVLMATENRDTEELVRRASSGDTLALQDLFSRHRERLERMVRLRLDPRVRGRLDQSDVVQEIYLEAFRRLDDYIRDPKLPFFLWLRCITGQKIIDLHRRHLGAQARDPRREVTLRPNPAPEATSAALAADLLGRLSTPSQKLARKERRAQLQAALESMDPLDRAVLVSRHFEHLTNAETAKELGLKESAASHRYVRALKKLRTILEDQPDGPP
jgi:RNA polymerase sigma-70 factor (ECF subfamily)